jgi:alpha-methylacyl-CoA racemase
MTGWGQTGPYAEVAGHDLNYIAVAGVLHGLGQNPDRPSFPTNLVGDFGGGSTYLVIGLLAALHEARASGQGQVVDAAIVDGAAHLSAMTLGFLAGGTLREQRAANLLDGGAPYYDVYATSDGKHMSVGALEPAFYELFVDLLGIRDTAPDRFDPATYPELRRLIADAFATRTQAEWVELFEGTDACVAGVIPLTEAFTHPHLAARSTYVEHEGTVQPAPAPRFSRTGASLGLPPAAQPGSHTREVLAAWGVDDVDALLASGAAVQA